MNFPTGQTPPPPSPYPTVPPGTPEPVGPGLTEPQRLVNVFIAPSKTFADIRTNPRWWAPWLLISIFTILFFVMMDQKVGFDQVATRMMANNTRMQQASPEQQAQALKFTAMSLKVGGYLSPAFILLYAVIAAAVLMATFNFGMDAQITFGRALAIVLYGWLVRCIGAVLAIITLALGNPEGFRMENPVGTNPAYFMDITSTPKFLYGIASFVDVITLWAAVVIGIGFAVNARKKLSTGTGVGVVLAWYFVYALISAGLASLR